MMGAEAGLLAKGAAEERDAPVERDLLRKMLEAKVISQWAVRPVCSTIHVECIRRADANGTAAFSKTAADVEAELEADALSTVVTDSSNCVRLVNDAYKQMVGQPECPWLDAVAAASRRISGEVLLLVFRAIDAAGDLRGVHVRGQDRLGCLHPYQHAISASSKLLHQTRLWERIPLSKATKQIKVTIAM